MKIFFLLALFISIFKIDISNAQMDYTIIEQRCVQSNLDIQGAIGRSNWALKCNHQIQNKNGNFLAMLEFGKTLPRPLYPLLSDGLDQRWDAPTDPNVGCDNIFTRMHGFCTSSCFTPEQKIMFDSGSIDIKTASMKKISKITTLTNESRLDQIGYKLTNVDAYQVSMKESKEEIIELTTSNGKTLRITTEHPILLSKGIMVRAKELRVGDTLLNINGGIEIIDTIDKKVFFGKVYNVAPASTNKLENIIIAQDLLVGSANFQFHVDFQDAYYRQLLRSLIDTEKE